jgi:hypothetical protein
MSPRDVLCDLVRLDFSMFVPTILAGVDSSLPNLQPA